MTDQTIRRHLATADNKLRLQLITSTQHLEELRRMEDLMHLAARGMVIRCVRCQNGSFNHLLCSTCSRELT